MYIFTVDDIHYINTALSHTQLDQSQHEELIMINEETQSTYIC